MSYYPYVGFHFRVHFEGITSDDTSFQSVKGLEVQIETETIKEGGFLEAEHTVPVRSKFSTLTLERGMFKPHQSALLKWCQDAFYNFEFIPINLQVTLMNDEHMPLVTWKIRHVLPKSWKVKDLNSTQNEVLIETLELTYNAFRVDSVNFELEFIDNKNKQAALIVGG